MGVGPAGKRVSPISILLVCCYFYVTVKKYKFSSFEPICTAVAARSKAVGTAVHGVYTISYCTAVILALVEVVVVSDRAPSYGDFSTSLVRSACKMACLRTKASYTVHDR